MSAPFGVPWDTFNIPVQWNIGKLSAQKRYQYGDISLPVPTLEHVHKFGHPVDTLSPLRYPP